MSDSPYNEIEGFFGEEDFEEKYLDESEAIYKEKYESLSKEELADRYLESHKENRKLSKYLVQPHQIIDEEKESKLRSVIETARDERPIQAFLKDNPLFLTKKIHPAHHAQICIPKPQLGGQLEPDFFIAGLDSAGFWWYGVELESPNSCMFTRSGEETSELKHAIRQVEDWRSWLRDNIAFAQKTLGYTQIDEDLRCYILIGKRKNEVLDEEILVERQRAVMRRDKYGLLLHHYEWLLDRGPTLVGNK